MILSPAMLALAEEVEAFILNDMKGMRTKCHAFPLTCKTKAGILRVKVNSEIECKFDEPSLANLALRNSRHIANDGNFTFSTFDMTPSGYAILLRDFISELQALKV